MNDDENRTATNGVFPGTRYGELRRSLVPTDSARASETATKSFNRAFSAVAIKPVRPSNSISET